MFQFVYWLRAIAAVMITNSHYADIWPVSAMAFGGHFGNCIYFFVSGFCLYNIRESFPGWYAKRIIRIYPALWIVAAVNLLTGFWRADGIMAYVHCLFYPTWYHFIGAIMLLYVAYYIVVWLLRRLRLDIRWIIVAVFALLFVLYLTVFDKSFYHIDSIDEKWCYFMFFESMLLGAYIRERYETISKKITLLEVIGLVLSFAGYFAGKKLIVRYTELSVLQLAFPILTVLSVCCISLLFVKLEKRGFFENRSGIVDKPMKFVAAISLEIYLGQYPIIARFCTLAFPLNFIVVTGLILIYAYLVHKLAQLIQKPCSRLLKARQKETVQ